MGASENESKFLTQPNRGSWCPFSITFNKLEILTFCIINFIKTPNILIELCFVDPVSSVSIHRIAFTNLFGTCLTGFLTINSVVKASGYLVHGHDFAYITALDGCLLENLLGRYISSETKCLECQSVCVCVCVYRNCW